MSLGRMLKLAWPPVDPAGKALGTSLGNNPATQGVAAPLASAPKNQASVQPRGVPNLAPGRMFDAFGGTVPFTPSGWNLPDQLPFTSATATPAPAAAATPAPHVPRNAELPVNRFGMAAMPSRTGIAWRNPATGATQEWDPKAPPIPEPTPTTTQRVMRRRSPRSASGVRGIFNNAATGGPRYAVGANGGSMALSDETTPEQLQAFEQQAIIRDDQAARTRGARMGKTAETLAKALKKLSEDKGYTSPGITRHAAGDAGPQAKTVTPEQTTSVVGNAIGRGLTRRTAGKPVPTKTAAILAQLLTAK